MRWRNVLRAGRPARCPEWVALCPVGISWGDCGTPFEPYPNGQCIFIDDLASFLEGQTTPDEGCYASGSQSVSGISAIRLVWRGKGTPPASVRVYGIVIAGASASAAPPHEQCAGPQGPLGSVSANAQAQIENVARTHSCSWSADRWF